MKYFSLLILFCFDINITTAQFAPAAGIAGSTAIFKNDNSFVSWATQCTISRGYFDISNTSLGFTTVGDNSSAVGIAGDNLVVSLGDGGSAILTFNRPITNGAGFDFAVFENSFQANFLELAFVEVSSDGVNYFRFPATSNTQTETQVGPFDTVMEPTRINNLAGKYIANYGTPFNLQELDSIIGLNIDSITHVKIIDVIGSLQLPYASYDSNVHIINDPYPTAFPSGGFDLDAVGVINQLPANIYNLDVSETINIYPNPATNAEPIFVNTNTKITHLELYNATGLFIESYSKNNIETRNLSAGFYFLKIYLDKKIVVKKLMIK